MEIRARSIDIINKKIEEYQNKKVIKFLNKNGYECKYNSRSLKGVLKKLKDDNKQIKLYKENQKLQKLNNYYKYTCNLKIKLEGK